MIQYLIIQKKNGYNYHKIINHNPLLQRAWNKYGESNFVFEIVEECNECELLKIERNVLGFETAYDLNLTKFSLGKTAIILLAQETNLRGKKHVYIYESYQNHFSYKLEISGVEYWEGEYWK